MKHKEQPEFVLSDTKSSRAMWLGLIWLSVCGIAAWAAPEILS